MNLSEHLKETADRVAGYTTGRLIVEGGVVTLQLDTSALLSITDAQTIEVRNDSEYVRITLEQALSVSSVEGWPLYAGLYARIKYVGGMYCNGNQ